ncbi:MAG: four helix bundle protein, partial [Bacteroidia bacterium]|nr:four helix bundle protein [Bacteroidia bacterium]
GELLTQLIIAHKIGYISTDVFKNLEDRTEKIKASLNSLINSRKN